MKNKTTVTICSSVAFYSKVLLLSKQLRKMGFYVVVPKGALKRSTDKRFASDDFKKAFEAQDNFKNKRSLMRDHFTKVGRSDIVLIVNEEKHGVDGYIGPNVLMEMAVAFHTKKRLIILNKPSKKLVQYEEIMGLGPKILDGDIKKLLR